MKARERKCSDMKKRTQRGRDKMRKEEDMRSKGGNKKKKKNAG